MSKLGRLTDNVLVTDIKTGKASSLFGRYWSDLCRSVEGLTGSTPRLAGTLQLGNQSVATPIVNTGYIEFKQADGTTIKVMTGA